MHRKENQNPNQSMAYINEICMIPSRETERVMALREEDRSYISFFLLEFISYPVSSCITSSCHPAIHLTTTMTLHKMVSEQMVR